MFDRVHNLETRSVDPSDTLWNVAINQPIKSLKGVLILFKDPTVKNPQRFYNPHVVKTSIKVEGKPKQLYSQVSTMARSEQVFERQRYRKRSSDSQRFKFDRHRNGQLLQGQVLLVAQF